MSNDVGTKKRSSESTRVRQASKSLAEGSRERLGMKVFMGGG